MKELSEADKLLLRVNELLQSGMLILEEATTEDKRNYKDLKTDIDKYIKKNR